MSESKTIRLMAAAKEFNIGAATLVEYLNKKGFSVKNGPMEKLNEEMYESLQAEYATDKKVKQKSEGINIPKGGMAKAVVKEEIKEKKEPVIEKTEVAKQKIDGPKVVDKIDLESVAKPAKKAAVKKEEEPIPEPKKVVAKKVEEKPVEESEIKEKKTRKTKQEDSEKVSVEAPKIKGPKIVDKIDLDAVGKVAEEEIVPVQEDEAAVEQPVIENIVERKKLDGLKIMGKINLPTPSEKSQSNTANNREKRKRKRIPVDKQGSGTADNKDGNRPNDNRNNDNRNNNNRGPANRNNNNRPGARRFDKPEDKAIEQSQIQEKIKETLAKLGGQTRGGKSQKSKYRKSKREEMAEKRSAADANQDDAELQVTEFISVNELASLMNVSFADVISKCMSLGMMVSINQRLDAEVIELVASEFGYKVKFINLEQEAENEEEEIEDDLEDLLPRPPIVTIMGHVDHGKTSLLDYIRKANVIAGEAGGITQHIGAYEVTLANGKAITFLDTPGHEAFTAMRARGAKVTDIAVIVVAADDAVMPQTREAISHAQAAAVPMIFAVNKIDKDGSNPEKIYEQLSGMNLLVESWGGKYQNQELAAKSGLNVDLLLEKILLEAEILDLKANPDRYASGTIIEASLDKGRGFVATILVQTGTLEIGDMIVAGSIYGRIKAMYNERGGKMEKAGPSTPVQILGLNGAPQAGEKFKVYEDEDEAKEVATHRSQILREQGMRTKKHITLDEIGRRLALGNFKQLNVIIKGDVDGSVEALSDSLQKLSTEEIVVSVVHKAVGQITESDVLLATASDAIILGFQVRPSSQANKIAETENIEIRTYSVIYDAIDEIKQAMEGMLEPKVERKTVCNIEVREVFKITGVGAIAGCFVLDGKIARNTKVNLIRDGIVVYNGELSSLKRFKDDVKEVLPGQECGLGIKNYNDLRQGDIIEGYDEVEVKRTL